jgi:lysophospholipase L1-like esterase
MKHFKNGALSEWQQVEAGTVLKFESTKYKIVSFQVNANSAIEVWAADNADMQNAVLQAAANDKCVVEYGANGASWVQIRAEKKSAVFVNIRDVDQRKDNSGKDSHVNIEPRVRNNDEFARMMHWVKLNEQRRNAEMAQEREELAKVKAELLSQKAETVQEPVAEPQSEQVEGDDATGAEAAK